MNQLSVDLHCIGLDLAGMTQVASFLQSGRLAHTPAAIKENPSIDFIVQSPFFLMVPVSNLAMVFSNSSPTMCLIDGYLKISCKSRNFNILPTQLYCIGYLLYC